MTIAELIKAWAEVESWRPIEWAPTYSVSSWGRVKGPREILKASTDRYPHVSVSFGGTIVTVRLHRLVAEAFLGPAPFPDALVAHNDRDTTNCRIDNLRWASAVENQADRIRHGTRICGSAVHGAKLKETDIPRIRARINAGERYPSIAEEFGVSVSTISLIKKGRIWRSAEEGIGV